MFCFFFPAANYNKFTGNYRGNKNTERLKTWEKVYSKKAPCHFCPTKQTFNNFEKLLDVKSLLILPCLTGTHTLWSDRVKAAG